MREFAGPRSILSSASIGIRKSFDKYYLDTWALLTDYIRVIYGKFPMQTQLLPSSSDCEVQSEQIDRLLVYFRRILPLLQTSSRAQTFNIYLSGLDQAVTVREGGL